jgi:DnaA-like protein
MYLAARIGRWSTTVIGRFYGGRDHSTVCYAIQRIESLSESDPEVDALLADLKRQLTGIADDLIAETRPAPVRTETPILSETEIEKVAALMAAKICAVLDVKLERALKSSHQREISTGL